jgi:hypothetical protein
MQKTVSFLIAAIAVCNCTQPSYRQSTTNEKPVVVAYGKEVKTNITKKIESLLKNRKKVTLLVLMPEEYVTTSDDFYDLYPSELRQWRKEKITRITGYVMSSLIEKYGSSPNFSLLDRSIFKTIMKEHELNLSGLTNPEMSAEFGRLTGANYIYLIKYIDSRGFDSGQAMQIRSLIKLKTAEIIAIDDFVDNYIYDKKTQSLIYVKYSSNGKEVIFDKKTDKWYYKLGE